MNSLCWNCRGIGNIRTVFALRDYIWRWNPKIVFLSETKIRSRRMEIVKYRLGFPNGLIVPSRGCRGGLALLWSSDTKLEIKSFSNHHIDAVITESDNGFLWRFTGFYGHPKPHLREESWKLLSLLNSQFNIPWFCCGDFNEILSINEKAGGVLRSQRQMDSFRQVVNLRGFKDLGYCDPDFTWCNMQEGCDRIFLRLDRALATSDWLEFFKEAKAAKGSAVSILRQCGSKGKIVGKSFKKLGILRSKVHWYREGDRNTKFFHAHASERRKKNTILGLWNDDGVWCESKESIVAAAISYFEGIYSTSSPCGINEVADALPRCVTKDMNVELTKDFTREEVIAALRQLHPTKAPGPDAASGQKIYVDKSSIFFSPNTPQEKKDRILDILGLMQVSRHNKYLRLPTIIGKSKAQVFAEVKDRVAKKLAGWKGKLLSIGEREILIKAVAQAVPTYTMSCFQLPKSLSKDLENMMRNFWWGQRGDENKIAWNRNQAIHEDSGSTPSQVWDMANRLLCEFKDACSLPAFSPAPSPSVWQAPPSGFFKINTDGVALDGSPSYIGVAICDFRGCLLAASSKILSTPFSAEITEVSRYKKHLKRSGNNAAHEFSRAARLTAQFQ
ncbi:uncharacterized protein LOC142632980 [Castanea sativa]|uniref:uncharacterized protein LOC142632980 n=1 Tax=Castanea sativa TaxID=21020 RepID=UPI003F653826